MRNFKFYFRIRMVLLILIGLLFLAPARGLAQSDYKINVSVSINADETFEALLRSKMLRELRDFSDVRIVEEDENYNISIVALQSGGIYFANVVITTPVDRNFVIEHVAGAQAYAELDSIAEVDDELERLESRLDELRTIESRIKDQFKAMNFHTHSEFLLGHAVYIERQYAISDSDVSSLAERIIASVDIDIFEGFRTVFKFQKLRDEAFQKMSEDWERRTGEKFDQ